MNGFRKVKEAVGSVKGAAWQKIEDINALYDTEAQARYLQKIMKEDGVSYEEACRLTREEPKYSMGWKMCSPAVVLMLKMPGGKDRFREWLTPEELEIFDKEVADMNFRAIYRKAKREKKKMKKKGGMIDD